MTKLRQAIESKSKLFDEAIAKAPSDKVALMLLRDKKRWMCQNDLYYLGILTKHTKFIEYFHKPFCDKVSLINWQLVNKGVFPQPEGLLSVNEVVGDPKELGKTRRLFLKFRSSFKSTIVTKLSIVQLLLNFPDIHIAISHNTQINASDILISIKNLFLTTDLKRLFPEFIPKSRDWGNNTGFSVACRKDFVMTGDNVEAIGIGTEVTGRKYHIFKNDDIVTEKSVTNEEQLRQSIQFIEMHKSLFVNPSSIIEDYSDTTYHFADATIMLQDDPDVETDKQTLLFEDAIGGITWQNKKYHCVLPELFTPEGIGKESVSGLMKDVDIFNLQYMLNPQSPRKVKFTQQMIHTWTSIPKGLNYYLVVDPADSEEKRACYTAMKVIGVDNDDNWFWVDGVFDKLDDISRIEEAIRLAQEWSVFEVLWENLSFGRTDNRNLERRRREIPNSTWQVRPINASRVSKDDRILGLNDRYARGKIFWPPKIHYYSKFEGKTIDIVRAQEYEFLGFPLVSHKDLLDAESFMLQIDLIKGDKQVVEASRFSHIKDPIQRGNTEVFWRDFETWKGNGFRSQQEAFAAEDNY